MTDRSSLERYLLDAIASVVPEHGGAYVAGPLATGKRHYELLSSGDELAASQVRSENENKMRTFVVSLRQRLPYPVIDPGLIKVDTWSNREIGDFYLKIVEHFVKEIWFMDGWEYSRGATKEFQFAVTRNVRCLDARGAAISSADGCNLISDVITHLDQLGLDASRFADRIATIRSAHR